MRDVTLVPNDDVTHAVLGDFGKLGRAWIEIAEHSADEDSIIEGILCGEFAHPLRVVAFNTAGGWSRDVSEDIALKVVTAARDDGRVLGAGARDFVERATGRDVSGVA
jgi:hypothetical protein